ncbi:T9SS type A sorting domain-containing protein [Psychroflexus sp. MBR-150]|jgi:hypothetical protein
MKKITLLCFMILASYGLNAQNPFLNSSYDVSSTVCVGDGSGNCDPANSNIPLTDQVTVTLTANPNEFVISDITGGLYEQGYGESPNPATVVVDETTQTLTVTQAPDVVFGGDFFNATGSYTLNASGEVDTFTLTWSNGWGDAGTNNYTLNSIISCIDPFNFEVTNTTLTSADFSWNDSNDPGTTFEINYGAPGFTAGSGTSVSNISGTSTTISNLSEATVFEAYIRANCGIDGNSEWVGPLEFFTLADCATEFSGFPLTENFDNAAVFASCYTIIDEDSNGTAWIQQELELQPLTTSFFATNGTNDATKEDYLFSPAISLTAGNTYDISLSYNGADAQNGSANESLEVLMAQGPTVADANAGTSIFTDTGIVQNGTFDNVENQALTGTGQFTPSTSGDYYLVFKSTGSPAPLAQTTGFLLIFNYSVDETLSTQDFEALNFNYFVDAQNNLNLSANQAFDQIKLHNLLGQQVLNQKLSAQDERIDLNALTSGVYLAQVQINDATKTFKIIKK